MAGLEPEIVWEIEAGHREAGGEVYQEALRQGRPPGFSPLQCRGPLQPWESRPRPTRRCQCSLLPGQRSPGRVHEVVIAAMLSGIQISPFPAHGVLLVDRPTTAQTPFLKIGTSLVPGNMKHLLEGLRLGPGREVKCGLAQMETAGRTLQSSKSTSSIFFGGKGGWQETQNTRGG